MVIGGVFRMAMDALLNNDQDAMTVLFRAPYRNIITYRKSLAPKSLAKSPLEVQAMATAADPVQKIMEYPVLHHLLLLLPMHEVGIPPSILFLLIIDQDLYQYLGQAVAVKNQNHHLDQEQAKREYMLTKTTMTEEADHYPLRVLQSLHLLLQLQNHQISLCL